MHEQFTVDRVHPVGQPVQPGARVRVRAAAPVVGDREAEQVAAAARSYRVFFSRVQRAEDTNYVMDHSSFIYLVGPDGRVRSLFRPDTGAEAMAAAVTGQLGNSAQGRS